MKRRLMASVLALIMAVGLLPAAALAQDPDDDTGSGAERVNLVLVDGQSNAAGEAGTLDGAEVEMPESGEAFLWQDGALADLNAAVTAKVDGGSGSSVGFYPALAEQLNEQTGCKTVIIHMGHNGAPISEWAKGYTAKAVQAVSDCLDYLSENGYEVAHAGYVWLQGESDSCINAISGAPYCVYTTLDEYYDAYMDIHNAYVEALGDGAVGGIITVQTRQQLNSGVGRNSEYCGVRAAQQALANRNADLIIASEITDGWRANKNSEYFSSSGGPIHYSQTGYNLIGADAGANLAEAWSGGQEVEYFQLVGHDGVTVYGEDERIAVADNMRQTGDQNESESGAAQLVVKTYPLYADCESVTMTLTDANGRNVSGVIDDNGYIADAGDIVGEMTLTVSAGGIEQSYVLVGERPQDDGKSDYYWDFTDGAESVTDGGWSENALTENALEGVKYYTMDTAALLPSDGAWTIEWKGTSPASCVVLANNDDERDASGKGGEYLYVANNSGEADKTELFFVKSGNAGTTGIRLSDIPDDVKNAGDAVWYIIHNGEGDLTLAVYGNGRLVETTLEGVIDRDYTYNGIRGYFTTSMPIGYNGTLEYVKIYHSAARLPGEVTEITGTVNVTVTAPVTGEAPDASVTGAGFTGEVEWSPEAADAFAAGTVYTATVTLTADEGYVFGDDASAAVAGAEEIRNVQVTDDGAHLSFEAVFPATARTFNDPSDADFYWDFTSAAADELTVPSVSGDGWKSNDLTFNGTSFSLSGVNGVSGSSGDRGEYFAMEYPALLPADEAWTVEWGGKMSAASIVFSDNGLLTGTLPGDGAHFHMWYDGNGVMNLRVNNGSTALTLDTNEYSGKDAVWYVINDGEGNLTLAACCSGKWLMAEKDGALTENYVIDSLMGIYRADMGFDYVGSMRYMKIYHEAAAVGADVIEEARADIQAPKSFAQPQTSVTGANFTGEVEWSPEAADAFAAGTVYRATVTLTAEEGYVFGDETQFTVPGGDIEDVTVSADGVTAVLTAVFPATARIDGESDYYWDFTDGAESVTDGGWSENALTENALKGVKYYTMDTAALLPADGAWTIEWKGTSPASCVVLANNDDERDASGKGGEYLYVANNSGEANKTELFFVKSGNAGTTGIRLSDIPDDVKKAGDAVWYIIHNGEGDLTLAVYGNGRLVKTTLEGVIDRDYIYNGIRGYYSTEYPIGYNGTLEYVKIYHSAAEVPAAEMNGVLYGSLAEAIEAAETASYPDTPADTSVITLLKDTAGGFDVGVEAGSLKSFKTQNIAIDLNGFTLTLGYPEVGSAGTKTNGIRVLAYSALKVSNGVIENGEGRHAALAVLQNYGTSVLENVEFADVGAAYNTIDNFGSLELKGNTAVPGGKEWAIFNESYLYSDDSQVPYRLTIADETVTVGDIMLDLGEYTHPQTGTVNKADPELEISAGSITSIASEGSDKTLTGGVSGGSFAAKVPAELCAEGYVPTEAPDADGRYTVIVPYTVSFDARGGKVEPSSALTNGAYKLDSLPEPTRRNYDFAGWYTEPRGGERVTESTVFEKDTFIYAHWYRDTDGGDDSTGGEPAYSVILPGRVSGGSVKSSASAAAEGARVTVTAEPDAGYELDGITVTDADGRELKLTDRGSGSYSFIMPAGAVRVAVSFAESESRTRFEDVPADAYFAEAVKWALDEGITEGMTDTLFGPYEECTRGQIVTFLWRAAGSPEPESGVCAFTDVDVNAYYYKAVLWAAENGITEGVTETRFAPDDVCTRGQSVTFLYRAVGEKVSRSALFSDVDAGAFYAEAVNWAVDRGVTRGTSDTTFSPDDSCLRSEIVTFLCRAYMER